MTAIFHPLGVTSALCHSKWARLWNRKKCMHASVVRVVVFQLRSLQNSNSDLPSPFLFLTVDVRVSIHLVVLRVL